MLNLFPIDPAELAEFLVSSAGILLEFSSLIVVTVKLKVHVIDHLLLNVSWLPVPEDIPLRASRSLRREL